MKTLIIFIQGLMTMALLCSIGLNIWLYRAAQSGTGYTQEQRAQMDALVQTLDKGE